MISVHDWKPLPSRVRYFSLERPDHYLDRLCEANDLSAKRLRWQVANAVGSSLRSAVDPVLWPIIERMGDLGEGMLSRAQAWAQPVPGSYPERFACLRCTSGVAIPQIPHVRSFVCFRHNRWLGFEDPGRQCQLPVGDPAIARVERLWRAGVRSGRLDVRVWLRAVQAFSDAVLHGEDDFAAEVGGRADWMTDAVLQAAAWPAVVLIALLLSHPTLKDSLHIGSAVDSTERQLVSDACDSELVSPTLIGHVREEVRRLAARQGLDAPPSLLLPHGDNAFYGEMLRRRPDLISTWDYSANDDVEPFTMSTGVINQIGWRCDEGHTWWARVGQRVRYTTGCPYCAQVILVPGKNDLASARADLLADWDFDANGSLRPEQIRLNSPRFVHWKCATCATTWSGQVRYRVSDQLGCPMCQSGRRVRGGSIGRHRLEARMLPEPLLSEWDAEANPERWTSPLLVTRAYSWVCALGHKWPALLRNRLSGTGCPYCAGLKALAGFNDLASLRPDLASYWDPSNALRPDEVTLYSNRRVSWRCACGHSWESVVENVVKAKQPCPRCRATSRHLV